MDFHYNLQLVWYTIQTYRQTANISRTVADNKLVDRSDAVGASRVGVAPTTSSFQFWKLVRLILESGPYSAFLDYDAHDFHLVVFCCG